MNDPLDLLIVGGGINGAGIARDAAGRGLSVMLAEAEDLAQATSSASSKLIHGGLRYLEHYEFRLVRESLAEREVLWASAPHIIWPLRFVLPVHAEMRPAWLLRLGLFLYDHIGGRKRLPASRRLTRRDAAMAPLAPSFSVGFEYSDCWVDDARLVVLNAVDASERGAQIEVGTRVTAARREGPLWLATLTGSSGADRVVRARALVNAAGPWVEQVLDLSGAPKRHRVRLVKGSHIVVPRLHEGTEAYTLQNGDGRIVFVIPYLDRFSLIGTTDIPFTGDPSLIAASEDETAYLCETVSRYLGKTVTPDEAVWSYSGVRPLLDDGGSNASAVTRDYLLDLDAPDGQAPLLTVFGGKITTFRRLAEHAMAELSPLLGSDAPAWTRDAVLPGGDIGETDYDAFLSNRLRRYDEIDGSVIGRLCRAYGSRIDRLLADGPGSEVAPGLFEAELRYMRDHEWARKGEDALWRRSKLGLSLTPAQRDSVRRWFES